MVVIEGVGNMDNNKVNELNLCIAMIYYILSIMPEERLNLEEIVRILDNEMDIVEKNVVQFPAGHFAKIYYDKLSDLKKEEFDNVVTNLKNKIIQCKDDKIFQNAIMILSSDEQVAGLANCIIEYKAKDSNEVCDKNIEMIYIQNGNYIDDELIQIKREDNAFKGYCYQRKNMISKTPIVEEMFFEILKEEAQRLLNLIQKIDFDSIISNDDYLEGGTAGYLKIIYADGNTITKKYGAYMPDDIAELYKAIKLLCDNDIKRKEEMLKIDYTYPVSHHIIENVEMVCQENPEYESFFADSKKCIMEEMIEAKDIAHIKGKKISEYLATFKNSDDFYNIVIAMGESSIYNRNVELKDNKMVYSMELDNLGLFRAVLVYNIMGIVYHISTEGLPIIVEITLDKKFEEIFETIRPMLDVVRKMIKGIEEFKIIYK